MSETINYKQKAGLYIAIMVLVPSLISFYLMSAIGQEFSSLKTFGLSLLTTLGGLFYIVILAGAITWFRDRKKRKGSIDGDESYKKPTVV